MAEPTIRMLWAIAKSQELSLTDEELHIVVETHTGKKSIKALSRRELGLMVGILRDMQQSASGGHKKGRTRGNTGTANQRRKIWKLTQELGWEKKSRVNGMCMRMFKVGSVEWLDYQQCSNLIEALKQMLKRKEQEDSGNRDTGLPDNPAD